MKKIKKKNIVSQWPDDKTMKDLYNIDPETDCKWYLSGDICCKDLDSGRTWTCTAPSKKARLKINKLTWTKSCPYPVLGEHDGYKKENTT